MTTVQGNCDARFERVRLLFQDFLDSGEEVGASIAVNLDGRDVIDLWGGYADPERTKPWERDTIVPVFSSTKCATSLAMLKLIDEGRMSIYDKVTKFWPEFGANGKENIEIRHIMSHSAGLPGWNDRMTKEDTCDASYAAAKLADQAPWWEPGTASGYHSMTFGYLVGEIVRRVTGKTLTEFFAEEIAAPLDADFQIGAREEDWPRIADAISSSAAPKASKAEKPGPFVRQVVLNPRPSAKFASTEMWRRAEIGSSNGHGNARGMMRMCTPITLGGAAGGIRILSSETVELIFEEQTRGNDLVLGSPVRYGIGFGLRGIPDAPSTIDDFIPPGKACYWGGWGGSVIIMDIDRKLTFAYAMNKMENAGMGNKRCKAYIKAVYEALGFTQDDDKQYKL